MSTRALIALQKEEDVEPITAFVREDGYPINTGRHFYDLINHFDVAQVEYFLRSHDIYHFRNLVHCTDLAYNTGFNLHTGERVEQYQRFGHFEKIFYDPDFGSEYPTVITVYYTYKSVFSWEWTDYCDWYYLYKSYLGIMEIYPSIYGKKYLLARLSLGQKIDWVEYQQELNSQLKEAYDDLD